MEILVTKTGPGQFTAATEDDAEKVSKHKLGQHYLFKATRKRNPVFHMKIMALLRLMWDHTPSMVVMHEGREVFRSFDSFRHDAIITAGHYHTHVTASGDIRLMPKSLSYSECTQEQAEIIFYDLIAMSVEILTQYNSAEQIEQIIDQIVAFG